MDLRTRKRVGVLIRLGLIALTVVFVVTWLVRRVPKAPDHVSVQPAPAASALGAGDVQIVSTDGSIDLILKGDKLMGGLSPAKVAEVKAALEKGNEQLKDSSGFGAMISGIVKSSVASAIGTHVTYPVSEITELRFEDGKLIVRTKAGGDKDNSFGNITIDDDKGRRKEPARFSKQDADRFLAAFNARKKELGLP